jgi:superfamily II DNA or RNA helicase
MMLEMLPGIRIDLLGGGSHRDLERCEVLISTVQACCANPAAAVELDGLVIADECHRYGTEAWGQALAAEFRYRLGLTATYERMDSGVEEVLDPYFRGPIYSLDYAEALRDDIIAPFKIAFLGVYFTPDEQAFYDEQDAIVRTAAGKLINSFDVPPAPFGDFMKQVNALAAHGDSAGHLARRYLTAFAWRRATLAEAQAKLWRVRALSAAARAAHSTLVFTQTKGASEAAAAILAAEGLITGYLHSDVDGYTRRRVLDDFAEGDIDVIAAPKLLDEGIDVPDADLAVIVAASRTRLQMVQRMGRVLRKKGDGRLARVVIMYVAGTSEDPSRGAHEAFIDLIAPVACDTRHFGPLDSADAICAYLNDYQPRGTAH